MDTMANKKPAKPAKKKAAAKKSPMKKVGTRAQVAPRISGNRNGRGRSQRQDTECGEQAEADYSSGSACSFCTYLYLFHSVRSLLYTA